ncbi:MAG TPA: DNA-binding protein Alba [Euryarchaeota archaeon]|nr:DNA/RNA-binding protein albA [archaeon]HEQ78114.1 DNA-binding protein Alba [Euryarchaeota archaeon]
MAEDNVVYIGNKPVMSYVLAVATQLSKANEVIIKSRGRAISRAVDTAEIVRNKFISGLKVKEIQIGTETVKREDGTSMNISSLEITLSK